ncbi:bifunctional diguanylate cyclase/phosphodiesterase [Rhodoferax sp. PAMC 29310]|uniref:sensor domain-containing protein n=1 Tax=Rhodoferax sp. PAMC 29310 TaxID=2822760 RepID=UPI001B337433|nr:bifunctional diguanylate cyclase/phosphodiesterase [Rhodoferax sp. PAMC 29310]
MSPKKPAQEDQIATSASDRAKEVVRSRDSKADLSASNELLRAIVNTAPIGIFWKDTQSRYVGGNLVFARDSGLTCVQEIFGRTDEELTWAEQAEKFRFDDQSVMQGNLTKLGYEEFFNSPTGTPAWFQTSKVPLHNDAGDVVGSLGIYQDITEHKQSEQALVASQQQFRDLVDSTAGIVWEADATTFRFNFVSQDAEHLLDFTVEEWQIPGFWVQNLHPDDRSWALEYCASCTSRPEAHDFEYRFISKDGRIVWLHDIVKVVAVAGQPRWLRGVMFDVTARKLAEAQLKLAASVFTHAGEGITITDARGRIVELNDTFTAITGSSREEALGQSSEILRSGHHDDEFFGSIWREVHRRGHWQGQIWNKRKNGEIYAQRTTVSAVLYENGVAQNYVGLISDITELKRHQSELERAAHFDSLTGLPNRLLLADRLSHAMNQCQRQNHSLAVVYLDLDNIKEVNDEYGHAAGDALLIEVSRRMKIALREGDTLTRLGGDEFVAVLSNLSEPDDGIPVLERLLQAAAVPVTVSTAPDEQGEKDHIIVRVSASMGVTFYPQDPADADQLMRHADQAMYAAKQAGKNRYQLFDIAQDVAIQSRREGLQNIRTALDRREFVLHYQPKVNMQSGVVTSVEALIRWQHPEKGLLPPAAFLPLMAGHPISMEVGEWVIETALSQASAWLAQGLDVKVSVNLDAAQLQQSGFAERLSDILTKHPDVPQQRLGLEVLESSALEDYDRVCDAMHACHALGVSFALDDFGTGHSSLTYLKRLPAQTLKIDQTFVRDMLDDPSDLAIVKGVIGLAQAFGRNVVAEGVETAAQGQALLSLGCEMAQDYGIARPMPANQIPAWVTQWESKAVWTD